MQSQLKTILGTKSNRWHILYITGPAYRKNQVSLGIDFEQALEAGLTGLNTRAGDFMNP